MASTQNRASERSRASYRRAAFLTASCRAWSRVPNAVLPDGLMLLVVEGHSRLVHRSSLIPVRLGLSGALATTTRLLVRLDYTNTFLDLDGLQVHVVVRGVTLLVGRAAELDAVSLLKLRLLVASTVPLHVIELEAPVAILLADVLYVTYSFKHTHLLHSKMLKLRPHNLGEHSSRSRSTS